MSSTTYAPRFRSRYNEEIREALKDELGLPNLMMVPKLEKIVLNMGVGEAVGSAKLLEGALADMKTIAGQKTGGHTSQKVSRQLQATRRPGHRLQGHPPRRPHVRILRPTDLLGHPANTGLPGAPAEVVRRQRQLYLRCDRTAHVSRD